MNKIIQVAAKLIKLMYCLVLSVNKQWEHVAITIVGYDLIVIIIFYKSCSNYIDHFTVPDFVLDFP